jgi:hypothetical protein
MKQHPKLVEAWNLRLQKRAEGLKLSKKSNELCGGNLLLVEGQKLKAESNKLWAEGEILEADGKLVWLNAVIEVYGNIEAVWSGGKCTLGNGEVYGPGVIEVAKV